MSVTKSGRPRVKPIRGIRALTSLNPYSLADMAGCSQPDEGRTRRRRHWSPGAELLSDVRDCVVEAIRDGSITVDDRDDRGQLSEIADRAPSIYTYARWREFVDLGAWQEESEFGDWPDDLTETAGIALYQIAMRLCQALVDEWIEARS